MHSQKMPNKSRIEDVNADLSFLQDSLSYELQFHILSFLAPIDLCAVMLTSKRLNNLARDNQLWFRFYKTKITNIPLSYNCETNYKSKLISADIVTQCQQLLIELEVESFKSIQEQYFQKLLSIILSPEVINTMEVTTALIGAIQFELQYLEKQSNYLSIYAGDNSETYKENSFYKKLLATKNKISAIMPWHANVIDGLSTLIEAINPKIFDQPDGYYKNKNELLSEINITKNQTYIKPTF